MKAVFLDLWKKLRDVKQDVNETNKYKKLRTDEERTIYTLKLMREYDVIPKLFNDPKDEKMSEKLRNQGNRVFLSMPFTVKNAMEATELYTKSIAYAPYPSVQLSLAYANRSAVLQRICKYEECIKDIDRVLKLEYPDRLRIKVYMRKIECLAALNKPSLEETIKEAHDWLVMLTLEDQARNKFNERLIAARDLTVDNQNIPKAETGSLPILKKRNSEIPCASDAVALKYNEQFGRHVVATRNIQPGELLAIEKPYSVILATKNLYSHCSNCLEICWALIPCTHCAYAMYCSEECRATNWREFHDAECPIVPTLLKLNFSDLDLCGLRLAIQAVRESSSMKELRAELKEVDEWDDPRTKGFPKNGILESNKYRNVYGLATNTEKRSVSDLFTRSLDASFMLYFLATSTSMFGSPLEKNMDLLVENADVMLVGGLIMRHQQVVPSNMHRISEERGLAQVSRGSATMPFFSYFNHCCEGNILRHDQHKHMLIYAIFPIRKGEQVRSSCPVREKTCTTTGMTRAVSLQLLDNYGQHYAIAPRATRQKELLKQYFFHCCCRPCLEDWPLYGNMKSFEGRVDTKEKQTKLCQALRSFQKYVDWAMEGDTPPAPKMKNDLLRMIQVLFDNAPIPCMEMCNVVETLKRVYDLSGYRFLIPTLEKKVTNRL